MFWVSVLYILASFLVSWPLSLRIGQEIPVGGDSWSNVWNLWWTRAALSDSHLGLLFCPLIDHPWGLSLALHSNSYFNTILTLPLQWIMRPETVHSLLLWVYLPASALTAYLLARRWVASPLAAFMAGWVYAFSPLRIGRYVAEQVDDLSAALIPLFVLFLLGFLARPTGRAALRTAFVLLLQLLASWYNGTFCYLFLAFALLFHWLGGTLPEDRRGLGTGLAVIILAPLILLTPLLLPMFEDLSNPIFAGEVRQLQASRLTSADLLAFVTPGVLHPSFLQQATGWHGPLPGALLERSADRILAGRGSAILDSTAYMGWVNLVLLIVCAYQLRRGGWPAAQRRRVGFWLAAVLVFGLLALGPALQIAGWDSGLPLPYALVNALPGLSILRAPIRLWLLGMLAVGVCVAFLLDRWLCEGRKKLVLALAVLIALDLALFPLERLWQAKPVPPIYEKIAADETPGAVLEIPSGYGFDSRWHNARAMYYQTRHGRPLLVGYISRTPRDPYHVLDNLPVLRTLAYETLSGQLPREEIDLDRAKDDLATLGVRYIILHPGDVLEITRGNREALDTAQALVERLAGPPLWEDTQTVTYRFEPAAR